MLRSRSVAGGWCHRWGASLSILVMVVSWIDIDQLAVVAAGLLILVAAVHFVMAFGLRGGLLVWSGDYPRRLPPELRRRSLGFGLLLLLASWLLAELAGLDTVPDRWDRSVGLVLIAFLGVTGLYTVARDNRWERYLFGPILIFAASVTGLLAFGP